MMASGFRCVPQFVDSKPSSKQINITIRLETDRKVDTMKSHQFAECRILPALFLAACLFSLGCGSSEQATSDNAAVQDTSEQATPPQSSLQLKSEDMPSDAAKEVSDSEMASGGFGSASNRGSGMSGPPAAAAPAELRELAAETANKSGQAAPMGPPTSATAAPSDPLAKSTRGFEGETPSFRSRQLTFPKQTEHVRVNESKDSGSEREGLLADDAQAVAQQVSFGLQPGEELWIIAKAVDGQQQPHPDTPGCGALMATLPNQIQAVPVPLKHTSVEGSIDGYIATVNVKQQFHNPYDSKIEAVYVFPLPQNAAVNEFVMTVGDRKIRGIIREREKAEQIYAAARAQGHVAALMTQERANIFTQKVANIEPGKQIDINIRYFNTLQYDDGSYEFVFPMVVGPRFNPPATADGVGAVARNEHGTSGQSTEVQYLAPNERSGHDVSVSLNISAGVDIEDIHCVNHVMEEQRTSESQRTITLSPKDSIPNKDFVLRYKVAGYQIKTALLTREDQQGKYFTMMLYPPAELTQLQRSAMEMVFLLDCSGSMKGKPMEQAKNAIRHALQSLTPRDTFQIIRFSNKASRLGAEPLIATEDNIRIGLEYLVSLNGTGGTQMIEGIKAALDFPHDEGRFRLVSFMTDGYIGNEQQILNAIHEKLGESRIFSFGVGSSPNRMLMDRMALLGRGAVAYLSLNDDAVEIMDRFNQRISHPAMTDLQIDWSGMDVADVYPQRLPDLIVGRPVVVTGRFKGTPDMVKVNGRVAMEPASFAVTLDKHDASKSHAGVAAVWARLKIKDLMNDATRSPTAADEIKTSVLETALAYNLMSSFTAFVAVDSITKTEGEFGTTVAVPVPVPVPVPDGVKYETTVGGTD